MPVSLAVALAGGVGAAARYGLDLLFTRDAHHVPWVTFAIIVSGSFALAWTGVPLAKAVLAVCAYRFFNLWLPALPAAIGLRQLKRWREIASDPSR